MVNGGTLFSPWSGESSNLTKSFQPVHQQEELVGAMLLRSVRINRFCYVLCQGLDSILKFLATLVFFPS